MSDSAFLQGIHHAYAQTDGSYKWPNSREGDLLREAKREIDELIRLLAESQAREKAIQSALFKAQAGFSMWENGYPFDPHGPAREYERIIHAALAMPSDSTALDAAIAKAKREVLVEAAEQIGIFERGYECDEVLRRMADELKGGEQ